MLQRSYALGFFHPNPSRQLYSHSSSLSKAATETAPAPAPAFAAKAKQKHLVFRFHYQFKDGFPQSVEERAPRSMQEEQDPC
jgi:hypothetical protein